MLIRLVIDCMIEIDNSTIYTALLAVIDKFCTLRLTSVSLFNVMKYQLVLEAN